MNTLKDLSVEQLRKVISIKEEIESLQAKLAGIMGDGPPASSTYAKPHKRHKMSAAGRAAIAAAARARWAKIKGEKPEAAPKKRRRMSAAGRARMAVAAKARWAKAKAAGKKRL